MSLRTKTLVITCIALITLMAALYGTSRIIFIRGLLQIEESETEETVQRTLNALSQTISRVEAETADWAAWDDTYVFIEDANEDYIRANLVDSTFVHLNLNLVLFVNSTGQVVFSKAFDLDSRKEITVPSQLLDYSIRSSLLGSGFEEKGGVSGIIMLNGSPTMIAVEPILKSDDTGPSRGILIFGRYLDATELSRLAQLTLADISMHSTSGALQNDLQEALKSLSAEKQVFTRVLSTRNIAAYTLLNDLRENPILIMRIVTSRHIYLLGQTTVAYFILTMMGIGLLAAIGAILTVQRQMLSRLAILVQGISHITESGDTSTRVSIRGKDELNLVADTINGMLAALEKSQADIRESEDRYRDLFENATDLIHSTTPEGHFLYANEAWLKALGYKKEELNNLTISDIAHPDYYQILTRGIVRRLVVGESVANLQSVWVTKGGKLLTVEGNVSGRFKDGKLISVRSIFHDVTEREQARERLQKLYEQEKALRQQLEREIQKRIEFTRALVHELKTPITPVMAAVELLLEEIQGERLTRLAQSIDRSTTQLNRRIDELLDVAKGETDMLQLDLSPVEVLPLLMDISYEMTPLALRSRQNLNVEFPPSLPTISADKPRLRQIITNLLNNAIKYTPEGGKITLRAIKTDANIIVEVEDTGKGISEEDQKQLFRPYYRRIGDTEHLGGLGLGLFLAKTFVELHGGHIWVKSQLGKGSIFGFSLPIKAPGDKPTNELKEEK